MVSTPYPDIPQDLMTANTGGGGGFFPIPPQQRAINAASLIIRRPVISKELALLLKEPIKKIPHQMVGDFPLKGFWLSQKSD